MTDDVVRRVTITSTAPGADEVKAKLDAMAKSFDGIAVSSDNMTKAQTSAQSGLERQSRALDDSYRSAKQYEKAQTDLQRALDQGLVSQQRHSELMALASAKYLDAGKSAGIYGTAVQAASQQAQSFANSAGLVGTALSSYGKFGVAAAAGIGAIAVGYHQLDAAATRVSDYARDLAHLASETGLTTAQIQALNKEASTKGIASEDLHASMVRLTAEFGQIREGGGSMLPIIRQIDSGLADQMQSTDDAAKMWTLFGQAVAKAGNEFQRAQLVGRRNLNLLPMLSAMDVGATAQKYAGRGLSQPMIDDLEHLRAQIDEKGSNIANKIAAYLSKPFLEAKLSVIEYLDEIAKLGSNPKSATNFQSGVASILGDKDAVELGTLTEQQKNLTAEVERYQEIAKGFPYFDNSLLERRKEQIAEITAKIEALQAKAGGIAPIAVAGLPMPTSAPPLAPPEYDQKGLKAQIADYQILQQAVGALVPVQAQVANEANKLALALQTAPSQYKEAIQGATEALKAHAQVQAELAQVAPGTYERQAAALDELKAKYPDLTAAQAQYMEGLNQQLQLAQAVTEVDKMRVQQQITTQQQIAQGATAEQAAAVAAKQRQITEAGVNAAIDQQVRALRDAVTLSRAEADGEGAAAKAALAYAQAKKQGASDARASALAAATYAQQQQQADAAHIKSLGDQNDAFTNLKAVRLSLLDGDGEAVIRAKAYADEMARSSDSAQAERAALQALGAALADADAKATEMGNAMRDAAVSAERAAQAQAEAPKGTSAGGQSASGAYGAAMVNAYLAFVGQSKMLGIDLEQNAQRVALETSSTDQLTDEQKALQIVFSKGITLEQARAQVTAQTASQDASKSKLDTITQANTSAQDQLRSLQIAGISDPVAQAQAQAQADYEKNIKDGVGATLALAIKNQELTNAINQNTSATNANTSVLSPLYSQDPRTSNLGFRSGSSSLKYDPFAQPVQPPSTAQAPSTNQPPAVQQPGSAPGQPGWPNPLTNPNGWIPGTKISPQPVYLAEGGIMTSLGRIPLRRYEGGGIATSPQMAIYGEGAGPEAFVPLANGAIPVKIAANSNAQKPVVINQEINIHINGDVTDDALNGIKMSMFQQSQDLRRMLGGR
jgi:hypothetical protein